MVYRKLSHFTTEEFLTIIVAFDNLLSVDS